MNISLIVSNVIVPSLIIEPVHEVVSDLSEALLCDDVCLAIVLIGGPWEHTSVYVS